MAIIQAESRKFIDKIPYSTLNETTFIRNITPIKERIPPNILPNDLIFEAYSILLPKISKANISSADCPIILTQINKEARIVISQMFPYPSKFD